MGKIVLVNYANWRFIPHQILNTITAKHIGLFDVCIQCRPHHLDHDFTYQNRSILTSKRGAGYWLWKPYIVDRALRELKNGDYLMYCDSGAYFVNPVQRLVDEMEEHQTDALILEWGFIERQYTKRDTFVLLDVDYECYAESSQRMASYFMLRKTPLTVQFVSEYLRFAQDERVITDIPNQMGLPNYPGFIDHRHDQSIFSLLAKKYEVPLISKSFVEHGDVFCRGQVLNHGRRDGQNFMKRPIVCITSLLQRIF